MTMTERQFFVVNVSEDGDMYVGGPFSKESVLGDLDEIDPDEFLNEITNTDPNYWEGNYLIIEGKIVTPKPKEVIMEYEI